MAEHPASLLGVTGAPGVIATIASYSDVQDLISLARTCTGLKTSQVGRAIAASLEDKHFTGPAPTGAHGTQWTPPPLVAAVFFSTR